MAIEIGINTEMVRHADKPFEYAIEKASEMGYKYVEINVLDGRDLLAEAGYYHTRSLHDDPLETKELLDEYGLEVSGVSAHAPLAKPDISVNFLKRAIIYADQIGAPVVCTDEGMTPEWMSDDEAFEVMRYTLKTVLPVAERHGVCLGLEPHQVYTVKIDTFMRILDLVESPFFGANMDTGNVYIAGEDPIAFLNEIAERVVHVHAKDISGVQLDERGKVTGVPSGCACGDGVIDWEAVIGVLQTVAYNGVLSVECGTEEQAADSLPYLRKVLQKRGA